MSSIFRLVLVFLFCQQGVVYSRDGSEDDLFEARHLVESSIPTSSSSKGKPEDTQLLEARHLAESSPSSPSSAELSTLDHKARFGMISKKHALVSVVNYFNHLKEANDRGAPYVGLLFDYFDSETQSTREVLYAYIPETLGDILGLPQKSVSHTKKWKIDGGFFRWGTTISPEKACILRFSDDAVRTLEEIRSVNVIKTWKIGSFYSQKAISRLEADYAAFLSHEVDQYYVQVERFQDFLYVLQKYPHESKSEYDSDGNLAVGILANDIVYTANILEMFCEIHTIKNSLLSRRDAPSIRDVFFRVLEEASYNPSHEERVYVDPLGKFGRFFPST